MQSYAKLTRMVSHGLMAHLATCGMSCARARLHCEEFGTWRVTRKTRKPDRPHQLHPVAHLFIFSRIFSTLAATLGPVVYS